MSWTSLSQSKPCSRLLGPIASQIRRGQPGEKIMKTQRAVLPLAFLSAAFLLACQDQPTSPDVEPQFARVGQPGPPIPPGKGPP